MDAAFLYERIAASEEDVQLAKLFREISAIERGYAEHAFVKLKADGTLTTMPGPSWRARMLDRIGKRMGYRHVVAQLMDVEKGLASASVALKQKSGTPLSGGERKHVRILQNLMADSLRDVRPSHRPDHRTIMNGMGATDAGLFGESM